MIDKFYSRNIRQRRLWQVTPDITGNRQSIFVRILVGLSILQGGIYPAQSAEIESVTWKRAFTNFCLQEAYSKPNAVEALYFVGQTANAVCGCGGELMGATLTGEEKEFYSAHQKLRGDTKIRWRKGLVQCLKRHLVPASTSNDDKVALSLTIN